MVPSIGRVVVYNHPGSADGKFPPKQSPAIIQRVNAPGTVDESCELFVMSVYGGIFFNRDVKQGDGPSQWNWPPRVN
jgi:hypothetical protein